MLRLWLDAGRRDILHRTKHLFDDDIITDEQYKKKRREILSKHGWSAKQELLDVCQQRRSYSLPSYEEVLEDMESSGPFLNQRKTNAPPP